MKNTLRLLAVAGLLAASSAMAQLDYTISGTVAYESNYVFRGVKLAESSFQPSVSLAYEGFTGGVWASQDFEDSDGSPTEIDLFARYAFAVSELVTFEVGGIYYYYSDDVDATYEALVGAAFDVPLSPSIYLYYDFELEAFTIEGTIGYEFDLGNNTTLKLSGYAGYVTPDEGEDFLYVGGSANVVYAFSENASVAAGLRVSHNDAEFADLNDDDTNFWGGISFTFSTPSN